MLLNFFMHKIYYHAWLTFTLTYALEALTTIIVIQSCIIIDTTVLSIGRRSSHNKSSTARISEASELGLSCKNNRSIIIAVYISSFNNNIIEHDLPAVVEIVINVSRS